MVSFITIPAVTLHGMTAFPCHNLGGKRRLAEGDTLGKLCIFFLGQACFDYPVAVGRVVSFHGCEPPFVGGFFQAAQAAKRRAWGGNPNKIPTGQIEPVGEIWYCGRILLLESDGFRCAGFYRFPRLAWHGLRQLCGGIFSHCKSGDKQNRRKKTGNLIPRFPVSYLRQ